MHLVMCGSFGAAFRLDVQLMSVDLVTMFRILNLQNPHIQAEVACYGYAATMQAYSCMSQTI